MTFRDILHELILEQGFDDATAKRLIKEVDSEMHPITSTAARQPIAEDDIAETRKLARKLLDLSKPGADPRSLSGLDQMARRLQRIYANSLAKA